jgi:ribosome assembly protein SQT1
LHQTRFTNTLQGNQVAPAELEAHLLSHPSVGDCAVISIPDEATGEAPKAYVVKSKSVRESDDDATVKEDIMDYVKAHKTKYKWVREIEFIDAIPKSASGKILRRILRDSDRKNRGTRAKI